MGQITTLSLIIRLTLALIFALPLAHIDQPEGYSWYVAPGGKDSNACNTTAKPCATIQGALDKAAAGDEIYIAGGTFTRSTDPLVTIDKAITLSGGWDTAFVNQNSETILDGQNARRVMSINRASLVILENLTIRNGLAGEANGSEGAGINALYVDQLTMRRIKLLNNHADSYGGGLNYQGILGTMENSLVEGNSGLEGGGIDARYQSDFEISYTTFRNNSARDDGGGLRGGSKLLGSLFDDNSANGEGGGVRVGDLNFEVEDCTFQNNRAVEGGAMYGGWLRVTNSTFTRNYATGRGGAISNNYYLWMLNSSVLDNLAFSQGGGLYATGYTFDVRNTTLSGNQAWVEGGAVWRNGETALRNSIFYGNESPQSRDCMGIFSSQGYNLVGDPSGCTLSAAPGDQTGVDPRLLYWKAATTSYLVPAQDSPAVDGGNPDGCIDLDGNPLLFDQGWTGRPKDGDGDGTSRCDIGSAEYNPAKPQRAIYIPAVGRWTGTAFSGFDTPFISPWPVIAKTELSATYTTQKTYTMDMNQFGTANLVRSPFESSGRTTLEVDARWFASPNGYVGASYGLVFGIDEGFENYFIFDISAETQQFELLRVSPGGVTVISAPKKDTAIHYLDAWNHMKVTIDGSQATLDVNGKSLGTYNGLALTGAGSGIMISSYSDYAFAHADFDNFKVVTASPPAQAAAANLHPSAWPVTGNRAVLDGWWVK